MTKVTEQQDRVNRAPDRHSSRVVKNTARVMGGITRPLMWRTSLRPDGRISLSHSLLEDGKESWSQKHWSVILDWLGGTDLGQVLFNLVRNLGLYPKKTEIFLRHFP